MFICLVRSERAHLKREFPFAIRNRSWLFPWISSRIRTIADFPKDGSFRGHQHI